MVGRNEEKQETVTETAMGEVMMGSSNDSRATFSIANAGASGAPAAPGVPSTSSPSSLRSRPVDDDRMRVAREACASLACLMTIQNNEDVGFGTRDLLFSATALASPDSAVIPGAVLDALENILCWSAAGTGAEWVEGIVSEVRVIKWFGKVVSVCSKTCSSHVHVCFYVSSTKLVQLLEHDPTFCECNRRY